DLTGNFLVVAATNNPAVNRAVFHEATAKNILCNAVDDPPFCDFYFPSVVRRGDRRLPSPPQVQVQRSHRRSARTSTRSFRSTQAIGSPNSATFAVKSS